MLRLFLDRYCTVSKRGGESKFDWFCIFEKNYPQCINEELHISTT